MERIEFPIKIDPAHRDSICDKNGRVVSLEEMVKVTNVLYGHGLLFNKLKRLVEIFKGIKLTQEGDSYTVNTYSTGGKSKCATFEQAVAEVRL